MATIGPTGATDEGDVLATVSSEVGTSFVTSARDVTFGRSSEATLRLGAAPVYDGHVPRLAGRICLAADRIAVENLDDTLSLDIRIPGRPLLPVAPGDLHSPREPAFDVLITGGVTTYELAVAVNVGRTRTSLLAPGAPDADPPTGAVPMLTDRQRAILDAYLQPAQHGGLIATHQQVADRLGVSRSTVRVECERIWSALFLAGVPMRDLGDARDEIVDAWGRHRF